MIETYKAGIQPDATRRAIEHLDSRLRGNDAPWLDVPGCVPTGKVFVAAIEAMVR